jgi:virginiamycin A acetyltransferase
MRGEAFARVDTMMCLMKAIKATVRALSLALVFPLALIAAFGRVAAVYRTGSQFVALFPGLPGDYLRSAYYRLTLTHFPIDSRIQFGSFFAHPRAAVGRNVYIGAYCVLGLTSIGDRAQIASGVQILSGRRQHSRDSDGRILGAEEAGFEAVSIGADCWIGAGSIIMAEVGDGTTIGAGSVVVQPIPAGCVAAGNPARIIRRTSDASVPLAPRGSG